MDAQCSNPQCHYSESGKCIEGYEDVSHCESFNAEFDPADNIEETALSELAKEPTSSRELLGKEKLSPEWVDTLLKQRKGVVVACIGPAAIGKTTLMACIFEQLSLSAIEQWNFAGSKTLAPFERLRHSARITSKRTTPSTDRTLTSEGLGFFHLAFHHQQQGKRKDLYFADRPGEDFTFAANNSEAAQGLIEVKRADIVLLLINGELLSNPQLRHAEKQRVRTLTSVLKQDGILFPSQNIFLICTKYDQVVKSQTETSCMSDIADIAEHVTRVLEPNRPVNQQCVAACPESLDYSQAGEGVSAIVKTILEIDDVLVCGHENGNRSYPSHRTFTNAELWS
ncbi:TRAFAC clade GTPase domain-containing protein [Spongiibacter marinus]|uniref:TRAFAC clade GTPase domain-containing protein n=1 Tax=Spongiibacter marinus TaxID=354246 RepID=UPI0019607F7F|nr:hypothetical protein [Spongiibacter marinus]MBM7425045.1 hypothetical protein [Spongiibacter marinus]